MWFECLHPHPFSSLIVRLLMTIYMYVYIQIPGPVNRTAGTSGVTCHLPGQGRVRIGCVIRMCIIRDICICVGGVCVGLGNGYIYMTIYVIWLIYVSVFFIIHGYYLLTYCCICTVVYDICTWLRQLITSFIVEKENKLLTCTMQFPFVDSKCKWQLSCLCRYTTEYYYLRI